MEDVLCMFNCLQQDTSNTTGVACSNIDNPPPDPPDPPPQIKVLVPAFLSLEALEKTASAIGTKEFFPGIRHGVKKVFHPVRIHSKCSGYIGDFRVTADFAQFKHFPLF